MKGLSLTLTIVIVAIVLLVTALVVMTIFGAQMAQIIGVLNPWGQNMLETNLCQQACSTWCGLNPNHPEGKVLWSNLNVDTQTGSKQCSDIMPKVAGSTSSEYCECLGIKTDTDQEP